MKFIFKILASIVLIANSAFATDYYVSNLAVNGTYVLGSDANSGLTPALAKLTITAAIAAASASDRIYINPTGTSYSENSSGLNYLQINKASLTIETDPTYVNSVGKATITSPIAGTRTINLNETGIILRNVRVDNAAQTRNAVFCQSFATHTIVGVDFYNLGANAVAITAQNNNAYNISIDKCSLLAANGNAAGSKLHQITGTLGGMATTIKGSMSDTTGGLFVAGAGFGGTVTIEKSSDGTRNSISNATIGIQNLSTNVATTFSIKDTDFIACPTAIGDGGTGSATLANLVVNNNRFSGLDGSLTAGDLVFISTISDGEIAYNEFRGAHRNIVMSSAAIAGLLIHDNVASVTGMGTGMTHFSLSRGGAGIELYNNRITSDTDSRLIALGGEGYASMVTNSGGSLSGDQPLGDVAGDTYIAQTFTYPVNTTALFGRYLGAFDIGLKKTGSPTGTVTAYLYTNNAGAPGTLVATSAYTLTSSLLTTSYQQVRFWFNSRTQLSFSTQYWIVLKYNGTIDGSNYVNIQRYTAGTAGQKSTDGLSWGATANAHGFTVRQINLEMTQPKVYSNELRATSASGITHVIILNGTDGGLIYNNQIYGGAIGTLFKVCDGSVQTLMSYNNLISFTNSGDGAALHDKGSNNAFFYNNTVAVYSGNNKALYLEGDWNSGYLNGTPTQSPTVKNNLFASLTSSGGSIVQLGTDQALDYTCINPTLDYNVYGGISSKTFAKVNLGRAATLTTYTTLPQFRTAVGGDANSLGVDPTLKNSDVLDPPSEPAEFVPVYSSAGVGDGVYLSNVLTDYFGNTRPLVPSIGALELYARGITATRTLTADRIIIR